MGAPFFRKQYRGNQMPATREPLPKGTILRLPDGFCCQITGETLGEGGGSLIYPAVRVHIEEDGVHQEPMHYALKECFPISEKYRFLRDETGRIVPSARQEEGLAFLSSVQDMQRRESDITKTVYNVASRMIPVLETASEIGVSADGRSFHTVKNTVTIMESLTQKGIALRDFIRGSRQGLSAVTAVRVTEQVLYALREVHDAGYLHLDIQDGNLFLKGNLEDASLQAALIDFGSARLLMEDGLTAPVIDRTLFSTKGFSAPEMRNNDGNLRLSPQADLYSVGYLLLFLLTGKRYEPETIARLNGGNILTPLRMRHTGCPSYLEESLQEILRRSLDMDPGKRYVSAEEMLRSVMQLREALEPETSSLHAVHYDAFICYKHGPLDDLAAKTLQTSLEHFHIPSEIRRITGKKQFNRVFTDVGELSGCADMGLAIRDALKGSEWLIVVCSPDTPGSQWVSQEIRMFLQTHDRSHIIPVLTSGDPEESFPQEIRSDRPETGVMLAADARAGSSGETVKTIRKDTTLRVAAPMLGVTYDALKQRRRTYVMRRAAVISAASAVLMAGFSAYTLKQSAEIKAVHRETLVERSRLLAEKSEDLLRKGDRMGAIRTALDALPESSADTSKPVTDEAVYALNCAAYSYWDSSFACFQPDCMLKTDTTVTRTPLISPDGSLMAVPDNTGQLYLFDLLSRKQTGQYSLADIDESCGKDSIREIKFLPDGDLLIRTDSRILCWNPSGARLVWNEEIASLTDIAYRDAGDSVVLTDKDGGRFYLILNYATGLTREPVYPVLEGDLKTGKILRETDISADSFGYSKMQACALSEDGQYLLIAVSGVMDEKPCALYLADLAAGTVLWKTEAGNDVTVQELQILGTDTALLLTEAADYERGEKTGSFKFFRLEDGSLLHEEDLICNYLQSQGIKILYADDGSPSILALWQNDSLRLLDPGSFLHVREYQMAAPILDLSMYDDRSLIAVLHDGTCWRAFLDKDMQIFSGSAEGTFSDACSCDLGGPRFILSEYSSANLVVMSEHDYKGFRKIDVGEGSSIVGRYFLRMKQGEEWYRVLCVHRDTDDSDKQMLVVSPSGSEEITASTDSIGYKEPLGIYKSSTEPVIFYLQYEKNDTKNKYYLCAWGLESNSLVYQSEDLSDSFYFCQTNASEDQVILYKGASILRLYTGSGFTFEESGTALQPVPLEEGQSVRKILPVPGSSAFLVQLFVLASGENVSESFSEITLVKWLDANTGQWMDKSMILDPEAALLGISPDGERAVFREKNHFVVRSLENNDIEEILPESCSTKYWAGFLDTNHLMIWGDSGYLKVWDLSEKKIVMTDDTALIGLSSAYKDGGYLMLRTQNYDTDTVFSRHNIDPGTRVYKIYDDGTFSHFFDLASGIVCLKTGEIISEGPDAGIAHIMDLDELIEEADSILDGRSTTEE